MNKTIMIILIVVTILLTGASYKFNIFRVLNEYEEECYKYSSGYAVKEVTGWQCAEYGDCDYILCPCLREDNITTLAIGWEESVCLKYHLVRKV